MAVSAFAALASTVSYTAAAGFAFAGFQAFAVKFALGAALRALMPKSSISGANRGYQVNNTGSALDHQIIYGKVRVGGAIVYDESTGDTNEYLHRIIAVAGHEIQSFDRIYIDDEYIDVADIESDGNVPLVYSSDGSTTSDRYDGKLRIKLHLGTSDQAADSDLVAESNDLWTSAHRLRGIAYMYVRLEYDDDTYPNGIPTFTATVKGKKVYNPSTDLTAWSDNPALCLRDYLTSTYGLSESATNIDDTLTNTAVGICNQNNTDAGTTRYTCNGSFTTASTPYDIINNLLTSMGGTLWYAQGKWRMKPAYWTAPVLDLDANDLRSSIGISTRHSRRDNFNVVKGTFRGEETNWQVTDYPQVDSAAFLFSDNNQESVADIDLFFTDNSIEARRIARIALEKNRQQLTISASFGLRAMSVQVGDNIRFNNPRYGWDNKEFEVLSWNFGLTEELDLQVQMVLQETSQSVFDEIDDGIVYDRDNTKFFSPFDVPAIGLDITAEAQVSNQKVTNLAVIEVTTVDSTFIDRVEVEYKLSSSSVWRTVGSGQVGLYEAIDLEVNFYDFRARAINTFNVKGEWEYSLNVEINAFLGDPSDVTNFNIELSGGTIFFSWDAIPDADLSHYQIRHNSSTTGATWGNSSLVIEKVARPSTSAALPARSGTFLIRAYDKENNFSENPTVAVVSAGDLPQLGVEDVVTEDPTFSGTKDNVLFVSSSIEIDDTTSASPEGTYFFANYVDTGSTRNARLTGYRTFTRKSENPSLLWDDIPQNFDSWPGLFDSWTDEDGQFGDVSVTVYVAATPDDPAGTPTWGEWELANGNYLSGRAFKFKAVLNSNNAGYTPSVTALSATVEY